MFRVDPTSGLPFQPLQSYSCVFNHLTCLLRWPIENANVSRLYWCFWFSSLDILTRSLLYNGNCVLSVPQCEALGLLYPLLFFHEEICSKCGSMSWLWLLLMFSATAFPRCSLTCFSCSSFFLSTPARHLLMYKSHAFLYLLQASSWQSNSKSHLLCCQFVFHDWPWPPALSRSSGNVKLLPGCSSQTATCSTSCPPVLGSVHALPTAISSASCSLTVLPDGSWHSPTRVLHIYAFIATSSHWKRSPLKTGCRFLGIQSSIWHLEGT